MVACAAQKVLTDGLMRRKLGYKLNAGAALAWELFLDGNPEVAAKIMAEKAANAAKYVAQATDENGEEDDGQSDDE